MMTAVEVLVTAVYVIDVEVIMIIVEVIVRYGDGLWSLVIGV